MSGRRSDPPQPPQERFGRRLRKRINEKKQSFRQILSNEAARLRKEADANEERATWLFRSAKNKSHKDLIRIVTEAEYLPSDIMKFFISIPREKKSKFEELAGDITGANVFITAVKVCALDKLEVLLFEFGPEFAEQYFIQGRVLPDAETVFHVIFRQDYKPESRCRALSILGGFKLEGMKSIIHLGTRSNPDKTVANLLQQPQHCLLPSDADLHRMVARELEKWMDRDFRPSLQFVQTSIVTLNKNMIKNPVDQSNPVEPQDPGSAGSAAGHALGAQLIEIVDSKKDVDQPNSTQTFLSKVDKAFLAREKWLRRTSGKTHKDLKKIVTSANFSDIDIKTFFDTIPSHRREDAIACLGNPAEKNIFLVAAKLGNLFKLNALVIIFRNRVDLHRYFYLGRGNKNQTILFYAVNRAFAEEIRIKMVNLCKEILQEEMFTLSTIKASKPELCAFDLVNQRWTETNLTLRKIFDDGRIIPGISMLPKRPSCRVQPDESIRRRGAKPFQINTQESSSQFQFQQATHDPQNGLYPRQEGEPVDDSEANRLARVLRSCVKLPGASPSQAATDHPEATSSSDSYSSDSANSDSGSSSSDAASSSSDSASSYSVSNNRFGSTTSDEVLCTRIADSTHKNYDESAFEEGLREMANTLAERCEGVQEQNASLVAEIAALRDRLALLTIEQSDVVHESSLTC